MKFETWFLEEAGIQLVDGDRGKNYPKQADFKESSYCLFLSAKNVTTTGFQFSEQVYINKEADELLRAGKLNRGDIVVTTRGTIGNIAFYDETIPFDNIRINSGMIIFRSNEDIWNRRLLYFLLTSDFVQQQIVSLTSGSAVPQLPARDLKKFVLPKIPLDVQSQIAEVIGSVSDKIELNRQINQTLEQIAQAIFKSWFVDFEPVKAKAIVKEKGGNELAQSLAAQAIICGVITLEQLQALQNDYLGLEAQLHPLIIDRFPDEAGLDYWSPETLQTTAALFPDALVESELGEMPEGWDVTDLKSVTTELRRGISPKYTEEDGIQVINQKCIRNHSVNYELTRLNDPVKRKVDGRHIEVGDVLVNSTGVGTLGRLAPVRYLPAPTVFDSHVTVVRADTAVISKSFLAGLMIVNEAFIEASGAGSTGQTELRKQVIEEILFAKPSLELGLLFDFIAEPMNKQIAELEQQQQNLALMRDALLPKLLSGELALNNVKTTTEAVAC